MAYFFFSPNAPSLLLPSADPFVTLKSRRPIEGIHSQPSLSPICNPTLLEEEEEEDFTDLSLISPPTKIWNLELFSNPLNLFQLMPTRTRFDLVLFCGSKKEKLASGIFEPFVSHLIFARDQISKGGYSISFHPPNSHSSWFTKSTFDPFVKFVNTPAITERFATLEKQILQIS